MRKINIPTPEHGFETLATSLSNAAAKESYIQCYLYI